jgi:hypothetical protein
MSGHRARSGSSPLRSPARKKPRWLVGRATVKKIWELGRWQEGEVKLFDFLFQNEHFPLLFCFLGSHTDMTQFEQQQAEW